MRCTACGLVYTDPQPRGAVHERYLHKYDLAQHFGGLARRKATVYERHLERLPQPVPGREALLDVGCGDGQFLRLAARKGWRPHGVELNPPAAAAARTGGVYVREGHFEEMYDLPTERYDLVTCWDAIEHTPKPRIFAERLVASMAAGAHLALTTLNRRSLVAKVFRAKWSMIVEDHFTYWDAASLRRLFDDLGLEVVSAWSYGLGRDFVEWADRVGFAHRSGATRSDGAGEDLPPAARPATRQWDVARPVLTAEALTNRIFNATALGVGLGFVFRHRHHQTNTYGRTASCGS